MNSQTRFVYDKVVEDPTIKTVLNIGYRHDSDPTIMNYLLSRNKKWTVLEIFQPNVDTMLQYGIDAFCMNVLDIATLDKTYDAIIWLHGPEHITWDQFLNVRHDIEKKANVLTLYQTPLGEYPQGELYDNPYEKHVSSLYPEMFSKLGYDVLDHSPYGEPTFSAWKYTK